MTTNHLMAMTAWITEIFSRFSRSTLSCLAQTADFLFGYDFFISYAHRDGTTYPRLLRNRLITAILEVTIFVQGRAGASG